MSEPLSKQQKEWNKQLGQHVQRYSYLRDWSQLAAWLARLKHLFADRKGPVLDKQLLLKRLATSLNPSLPVALHQAALEIYEMLFAQAIVTGQELPTACIGLFSFFGQANVKNKTRLVEIFGKHLPAFGRDLQLLAVGLTITVLPALNEMHEALVREVSSLLDLLARPELIGLEVLAEALWVAILRSSVCRVAGLKFLSSKLGRGAQDEENDEEDTFWNQVSTMSKKHESEVPQGVEEKKSQAEKGKSDADLLKEYCPNLETIVVNALMFCIQDPNVLAIKASLDFLYKYLPLRSENISEVAKMRLARSVVWLLGKRDTSVARKINLWLFGKPDDQNQYRVDQPHLQIIVGVLTEFLQRQASLQPLKIAINLLTEHEALPPLILGQLVPHLLQFCIRQDGHNENAKEAAKHMHRLIDRVRPHLPLFSLALAQSLTSSISARKFTDAQQSIVLSAYFVERIVKPEDLKGAVRSFLKLLLEASVLTRWEDRPLMRVSLGKTIEVLERHRDLLRQSRTGQAELHLLLEHNRLFSGLLQRVAQSGQLEVFEEEISLMNRLLAKIQEVYQVAGEEWLANTIRNIALSNPQHFLSAIEALGEVMERENRLGREVMEQASASGRGNFVKNSLSKLWGMLSLGHLQSRVIPLLLRFVRGFPLYFQELLRSQFESSSQLAIIKFRLFWEVAPKHPQIMSGEQLQETSKTGLFQMLDFLDSANPLLKYHAHLWITETFPAFHRILNPVLDILLRPQGCWYRTPQGQFIFAAPPEVPLLLRTLRHLRSFTRLVPEQFGKFALKPLTPRILPAYHIFKGTDPSQHIQVPFSAALFQLVVRFTESKLVGGDNCGVDLAACQLLDAIVRAISGTELGNNFVRDHFRSLLRALHFATVNNEHLLQIQLLDLLRLLLGGRVAESKVLREVVAATDLISAALEGVGCSFPYIKQRFVRFLNECVPLLLECAPGCAEAVSRVLNTFTAKIAYANSKKVQASSLKDLQISQKNAEILILFEGIKDLLGNFLQLQLRPFEKERSQHDTDSGLFSFYSWKSYIYLRVQPRPEARARKLQEDITRQILNELPSLLAIIAACWTLSELRPYYRLTKDGLAAFDYEAFLDYNKALSVVQSRLETEDSVQAFLVAFIRVLLNAYPCQTMRAVVACWTGATKDIETRLRLLELLVFSGIPVENFYSVLADSLSPERVGRKRRGALLQTQRSGQQEVLQLCQAFSHYNFQNPSYFQTHNLTSIWLAFCRFLRLFDNTRFALTLFAQLELVHLFLCKNNPKEIVREERLRKDLQALAASHNDLHHLICGKLKVDPGAPTRLASLAPLPSSFLLLRAQGATAGWEESTDRNAGETMRLMAVAVARRVSFNFIACLQNESQIGLVRRVREVVVGALGVVQQKQGVRAEGGALVEGASELVLCLLEGRGALFAKQVKGEILQLFNREDFFICSSRTLQAWARIIDMLIDSNRDHDVFQEYLEKVSLAGSIFSSYTFETKKKIKSFERICFILYSGRKDKYTDRAHLLVDKISEVIKHSQAPQPVLILVFFCLRVLILRTSQEKLTKLLASLWQLVLFLLGTVFAEPPHRDRLNLHWAALKLVELISLMQMPEFHPHQWTFFYDFVGLRFMTHAPLPQETELKLGLHPRIRKLLPEETRLVWEKVGTVQEKRHLIIKEDKIDDIELLKTKALLLSSYLVASSGCRMTFDMRQVEQLIENDFLNLDDFIFKVK